MGWPKEAFLYLRQIVTPNSRPATGGNLLYAKSDDKLYVMNSAGVETAVGGGGDVTLNGVQTLTNKTLTSPIMGTVLGANGLTVLTFLSVPSSVNNLSILNNIATGSPRVLAEGTDANISINLVPKGTGTVKQNGVDVVTTTGTQTLTNKTLTNPKVLQINDITNDLPVLQLNPTVSAVNFFAMIGAPTTGAITLAAAGADANIGINLLPKGTGALTSKGIAVADVSTAQTLTNKTLSTGTLVGAATTDISGAWTAYTPTFTATTTNPTLGTGSSVAGAYMQIGKTVLWRAVIICGTASTAVGSGTYEISLPVAAAAGVQTLGSGLVWDSATVASTATAIKSTASASKANMFAATSTNIVNNAISGVAINRRYEFSGEYEAA